MKGLCTVSTWHADAVHRGPRRRPQGEEVQQREDTPADNAPPTGASALENVPSHVYAFLTKDLISIFYTLTLHSQNIIRNDVLNEMEGCSRASLENAFESVSENHLFRRDRDSSSILAQAGSCVKTIPQTPLYAQLPPHTVCLCFYVSQYPYILGENKPMFPPAGRYHSGMVLRIEDSFPDEAEAPGRRPVSHKGHVLTRLVLSSSPPTRNVAGTQTLTARLCCLPCSPVAGRCVPHSHSNPITAW